MYLYEDLESECRLVAEAEKLEVNVILTTNGNFVLNLDNKAMN